MSGKKKRKTPPEGVEEHAPRDIGAHRDSEPVESLTEASWSEAPEDSMHAKLKRHEVHVLLRAGHSTAEVARIAAIPERSVRRIAQEPAVHPDEIPSDAKARGIGRPSKAEPFEEFLRNELEQEPHLKSVELLRRARLKGYAGGKSALYALVARIRPRNVEVVTRFEGLPGEFSQHDFGEVRVTFQDGRTRKVVFFASRLKYSRFSQVSIVPDQTAESLIRALTRHFVAFGGIPLLAVFDRPKTIALEWKKSGEVTRWNPMFGSYALEQGIGVEVCWPYAANQKGSVENLVGWVKGSFFKQRRFLDEEDLNHQLGEWLEETNERRPNRATQKIPRERLNEELARLRAMKVQPETLAIKIPVQVGPTSQVLHETNTYSMPTELIGQTGTILLFENRVRVIVGHHQIEHPRLFGQYQNSVLPEHRAERVARVPGKRGRTYLKRQDILDTGPTAWTFLTELLHRRPRVWMEQVDRLHSLLQAHGPVKLTEAFQAALREGVIGAEYVEILLTSWTDLLIPSRAGGER